MRTADEARGCPLIFFETNLSPKSKKCHNKNYFLTKCLAVSNKSTTFAAREPAKPLYNA